MFLPLKTFVSSRLVHFSLNSGNSRWGLTILYTHPRVNSVQQACHPLRMNPQKSLTKHSNSLETRKVALNSSVCLSWSKTLAIPTCVHFPADRATLSVLQYFDFTLGIDIGINRAIVSNKKLRITHTYLRLISPEMDHSRRMSQQAVTAETLKVPLCPVTTLPLGSGVYLREWVRLKV